MSVDPYITVEEGHGIGKRVKETLMKQDNVQNVFVHINPYSLIDMEAVQRGSKVVDELKEQLFRLKGPLGLTNENERNCHPLICLV